MKATATAPSNIAFIKYWGKKDKDLRLPTNGSISVNLDKLITTTTVAFDQELRQDEVIINGKQSDKDSQRVTKHLDRVRKLSKLLFKARVESQNSFPTEGGLASSASGFAALAVASAKAAGLSLSEKELSILARLGSGSACRSIPDGFVEWLEGDDSDSSYAVSLYPHSYWDLSIVVAIVEAKEKEVSSTEGQERIDSNPFFPVRLRKMSQKISALKQSIENKDFTRFGEMVEAEALELHAMAFTSKHAIIYWLPATISLIRTIQTMRKQGLEAYFTIDAGPHVHVICRTQDEKRVFERLKFLEGVQDVVINKPAVGARLAKEHLF